MRINRPRARRIIALALLMSWAPMLGLPGFGAPAHVQTAERNFSQRLDDMGQGINRSLFSFNQVLGRFWNNTVAQIPPRTVGAALGGAIGNLLSNWVNEPLTMISYAGFGQFSKAGVSGQRFLINNFYGWGGINDAATAQGVIVPRFDLGLALCTLGVPAGPYVVLAVIGQRNLRDGIADVALTQAIAHAALIPAGGDLVGEVASLAMVRQIDTTAVPAAEADYDRARIAYLASRQQRCDASRAARCALIAGSLVAV